MTSSELVAAFDDRDLRSRLDDLGEGAGITVAVIDDAIDTRHPEFTGRVLPGLDVASGTHSTLPRGWQPHGTEVAGLAVAAGIRVVGAAPRASLLPVRISAPPDRGGEPIEAEAMRWAAEQGADVICCAWAPDKPTQDSGRLHPSTRAAIDWAVAHGRSGKGCVILFSSGNDDCDIALNGYANHPAVIAVGACNCRGRRASYSSWGQALWCVVLSNEPRDPVGARMTYTTTTPVGSFLLGDTLYTQNFGFTSAACAIAAGVCAQILSVDPGLTWREVREIIAQACQRIDEAGGSYDQRGHSPYYGFGRLDPARALEMARRKIEDSSV